MVAAFVCYRIIVTHIYGTFVRRRLFLRVNYGIANSLPLGTTNDVNAEYLNTDLFVAGFYSTIPVKNSAKRVDSSRPLHKPSLVDTLRPIVSVVICRQASHQNRTRFPPQSLLSSVYVPSRNTPSIYYGWIAILILSPLLVSRLMKIGFAN